jgi:hypothetical protein
MKTKMTPEEEAKACIMNKVKWTTKKPKADRECILVVATVCYKQVEYTVYKILKTDFEDGWYWGIFTGDGEEWGDYDDLKAAKYCRIGLLKPKGGSK